MPYVLLVKLHVAQSIAQSLVTLNPWSVNQ